MKMRYIITILFVCLIFSCKTKKEKSIEKLFYSCGKRLEKTKCTLIIIPLDGCGSCISPSISFANENNQNDNLYIVVSTLDRKKIHMLFNVSKFSNTNFIIDAKCVSERLDLVSTATNVFFMEKGEIKRKETVTHENSVTIFEDILRWN